jgi:ABC-type uncharacterized transport system permease subunit
MLVGLKEGPIRRRLREWREKKPMERQTVKYTNVALADLRKGQAGPVEIRNRTQRTFLYITTFQSPITGQFFIEIYDEIHPGEIEKELVRPGDYLQPNIRPTL